MWLTSAVEITSQTHLLCHMLQYNITRFYIAIRSKTKQIHELTDSSQMLILNITMAKKLLISTAVLLKTDKTQTYMKTLYRFTWIRQLHITPWWPYLFLGQTFYRAVVLPDSQAIVPMQQRETCRKKQQQTVNICSTENQVDTALWSNLQQVCCPNT